MRRAPTALRRALMLVVLGTACSRDPGEAAWVAEVARQHAQADRLLDEGDAGGARRVLQALVEAPARPLPAPLAQDARFRLARIALASGDAATAAREAEAGLALGAGRDLQTANLLIVRAAALEGLRRGAEAAADYERALAINEALLGELLPPP
jgi:hypothetical protein